MGDLVIFYQKGFFVTLYQYRSTFSLRYLYRYYLLSEISLFPGLLASLITLNSKSVLLLPGNLTLPCTYFCGYTHCVAVIYIG